MGTRYNSGKWKVNLFVFGLRWRGNCLLFCCFFFQFNQPRFFGYEFGRYIVVIINKKCISYRNGSLLFMMRCDDTNMNGTPTKVKFHWTFYVKKKKINKEPNRTKLHNKTMSQFILASVQCTDSYGAIPNWIFIASRMLY